MNDITFARVLFIMCNEEIRARHRSIIIILLKRDILRLFKSFTRRDDANEGATLEEKKQEVTTKIRELKTKKRKNLGFNDSHAFELSLLRRV